MRRPALAAMFALLIHAGVAPAFAEEATLSQMVDGLQRLQVRIAAGDKTAYAAEPAQLQAISAVIVASSPQRWKDRNESIAAIVYLLSGGQPRDIAKVLQGGAVSRPEDNLMRGALAYVLGRERDAAGLIGVIDPRTLDQRIAGQFAYVLGVMQIPRDAKKALGLLNLARLLAPGGLVEEAALRREILLAGDRKDADQVALLSRQYLVRFGSSIYAGNFMQGFALTVVRRNLIDSLASFETLRRSARSMNTENRRAFMLAIARSEVEEGKFDIAEAAASAALHEAASDSPDEARGKFYQGAARIFGEGYDEGLAQLGKIASARLGADDRALLAVVRDQAMRLRAPTQPLPDPRERIAGDAPPAEAGGDPASTTIGLAEAAIARTAGLVVAGGSP